MLDAGIIMFIIIESMIIARLVFIDIRNVMMALVAVFPQLAADA